MIEVIRFSIGVGVRLVVRQGRPKKVA